MLNEEKKWTMKDVQKHLHDILQADHPLTQDQRKALKGTIEMCEVWEKISPHFAKAVRKLEEERTPELPPCSSCQATKCPDRRCCGYCHHVAP